MFRRHDPRRLFAFREGKAVRRVDPLAVETALVAKLGDDWWSQVGRLADKPGPMLIGTDLMSWQEKYLAHRKMLLPVLRAAFGVGAWDEKTRTGLTDLEVQAVGEGFRYFCADLYDAAAPFREAAVHGLPPPREPRYAEWVGMYLGRRAVSRQRNRMTAEANIAAWASLKKG